MQFPHCDARILHAPGECEYCDRHPDWQDLRKTWMVAFTGHEPRTDAHAGTQVPCPADFNRPPSGEGDHRRWAGNVATTAKPVNETFASKVMYGDWEIPVGGGPPIQTEPAPSMRSRFRYLLKRDQGRS